MRPRLKLSRIYSEPNSKNNMTTSTSSILKSLLLLLLLVIQNPASCLLQAEHDVLHRGAGTSFSLATAGKSGSKQVHMQVCITIGCCHHVCRQFLDDSTSESQAQELAQALAPFSPVEDEIQHEASQEEEFQEMEPVNESVALIPSILEWTPRDIFSPSIKFLRVLNTGNSTWIGVSKAPVCTDEQFSVQEIESSAIAPGESLTIPVVFIPRKAGAVSGKIILQTSAGTVSSQLRGGGKGSPYQASIEAPGTESSEAQSWKQLITFRNPHDEALQIEELQVWPRDSYNKALCLSDESDGRIISCFADGFPKAYLSDSRYEKYSHGQESISLKPLDSWSIESGQKIHVAELEVQVTKSWSGLVYMKFSRSGQGEVLMFPVEVEMMRNSEEEEVVQRSPETTVDRSSPPASGPGKWMPTSDLVALKVAEALLKDLSHTLLRQSQVRKGSLTANRREQSVVPEDQISFQMVQTGVREALWINLVNPTSNPLLVNLILPLEVKSKNCRYWANWFWQGQHPQLHRESSVFSFEAGAQTEATIPGHGKVSLGPLTFQPKHKCDWSSLLFIKNNSSGLEWVPVRGRAGSAKLEFLENSSATRRVEMVVQHDHSHEDHEQQLRVCHQAVVKTVQAKNVGNLPLEVSGMDLSEAPRITLRDGRSFNLEVGETAEMEISYQPDFHGKATKQVIKLATSVGVVKLPVVPRLSRTVVSLCRNSSLQERLVLPVSICALVLVMGVFFWLLLQELSAKGAISNQRVKSSTWKEAWRIMSNGVAGFRKASCKKPKMRFDESGVVTLKTLHQEHPEKCKLRKKKKMKSISSSSPRSQSSSSTPGSPHSGSDTETQLPAIERILSSTRFSEVKATPKKTKTRISVVSEEVAIDRVHVEPAWNPKLGAGISTPKAGGDIPSSAACTVQKQKQNNPVDDINQKNERSNSASSCATSQVSDGTGLYAPVVAAAAPPMWAFPESEIDEAQQGFIDLSDRNNSGTTIGEATGMEMEENQRTENLYDIWGTDHPLDRKVKQQRETLTYDIWGDHLTEIFSAFSSPNSPSHFSGNNQSFFSQTLHSGASGLGGVARANSTTTGQQQLLNCDHFLFPNSEEDLFTAAPGETNSSRSNLQMPSSNLDLGTFLPQAETCAGLPEPPFLDWNGMYRLQAEIA